MSETAEGEATESEIGEAYALRNLGLVVVNFGILESTLRVFIGNLMIKATGATGKAKVFQTKLAATLTSELPFYKLLTMIAALFKYLENDQALLDSLDDLIKRVGHAANQRDTLMHSSWFMVPQRDGLVRLKVSAKRKGRNKPSNLKIDYVKMAPADIGKIADELWDTYLALNKFMASSGYETTDL
jgi:hypothetical protein